MTESEQDLKETEICNCECHSGQGILHCIPCCELTEENYIVDGVIDIERWSELFTKQFKVKPTITKKNGKIYWVHK